MIFYAASNFHLACLYAFCAMQNTMPSFCWNSQKTKTRQRKIVILDLSSFHLILCRRRWRRRRYSFRNPTIPKWFTFTRRPFRRDTTNGFITLMKHFCFSFQLVNMYRMKYVYRRLFFSLYSWSHFEYS